MGAKKLFGDKPGLSTRLLHMLDQSYEHGAIHPPVQHAVTFGYNDAQDLVDVFQGKTTGYRYSRQASPTLTVLESRLTALEQGVGTVAFASGMAAIAAVFQALLHQGDHIIASQLLFANTLGLFQTLQRQGVAVTFVDPSDAVHVAAAWQDNTRFVFVESIANPRTQIADIEGIAALCKQRGAISVVDNTLVTAATFLAKDAGVDLVLYSLTKHYAGHGAVLAGCVIDCGNANWSVWRDRFPAAITNKPPVQWALLALRARGLRDGGGALAPQAAADVMLGMETMALRLERIATNAKALATMLACHPRVKAVYHPSLPNHPQHSRATALLKTYGGILSFELAQEVDPIKFLNRLHYAINATHLGDNRTLVLAVAQTVFYEAGPTVRAKMGVAEGLIRVSLGIEDTADIVADFCAALEG